MTFSSVLAEAVFVAVLDQEPMTWCTRHNPAARPGGPLTSHSMGWRDLEQDSEPYQSL
jgi:hypothetical protein